MATAGRRVHPVDHQSVPVTMKSARRVILRRAICVVKSVAPVENSTAIPTLHIVQTVTAIIARLTPNHVITVARFGVKHIPRSATNAVSSPAPNTVIPVSHVTTASAVIISATVNGVPLNQSPATVDFAVHTRFIAQSTMRFYAVTIMSGKPLELGMSVSHTVILAIPAISHMPTLS